MTRSPEVGRGRFVLVCRWMIPMAVTNVFVGGLRGEIKLDGLYGGERK